MPVRWLVGTVIALVLGAHYSRAQPRPALPPAVWQPTGERVTWRNLSFIVPTGMRGVAKPDGFEMSGLGVSGRGGQCHIIIFAETPSGGDLATRAQDFLVDSMAVLGVGVADSRGGSNLIGDRRVGRTTDGWRYVELNGMVTPGGAGRARIVLIDHGVTVVPILAVSDHLNGCVGLTNETTPNGNTITWVALYHSLKLPGATPSDHLREQVIGRWESFGRSAGGAGALQDEAFGSNGRYGGGSVGADSSGKLMAPNLGDGRYIVDESKLVIFPRAGPPEAVLIRVIEDYSETEPSKPTVRLCKLKVDATGPYEICLSRLEK